MEVEHLKANWYKVLAKQDSLQHIKVIIIITNFLLYKIKTLNFITITITIIIIKELIIMDYFDNYYLIKPQDRLDSLENFLHFSNFTFHITN